MNVTLLEIIDHSFHYEMENLCRVFFPNDEIKVIKGAQDCDGDKIITVLTKNGEDKKVSVSARLSGREYFHEITAEDNISHNKVHFIIMTTRELLAAATSLLAEE